MKRAKDLSSGERAAALKISKEEVQLYVECSLNEAHFSDDSMMVVRCIAVENEIVDNMYRRPAIDCLICNDPLAYAGLVLYAAAAGRLQQEFGEQERRADNLEQFIQRGKRNSAEAIRFWSTCYGRLCSVSRNAQGIVCAP